VYNVITISWNNLALACWQHAAHALFTSRRWRIKRTSLRLYAYLHGRQFSSTTGCAV